MTRQRSPLIAPIAWLIASLPLTLFAENPTGWVEALRQAHPVTASAWIAASSGDPVQVTDAATGAEVPAALVKAEGGTQLLWQVPADPESPPGKARFTYTLGRAGPALSETKVNLLAAPGVRATLINAQVAEEEGREAIILGSGNIPAKRDFANYTSATVAVEAGRHYRVSFDYRLQNAPADNRYGLSLNSWLWFLNQAGETTWSSNGKNAKLQRIPLVQEKNADTGGWKSTDLTFTPPPGTTHVRLTFRADAGKHRGVALADLTVAPTVPGEAHDGRTEVLSEGVLRFDFGREGSPVFAGFTSVTPKDAKRKQGWGFRQLRVPAARDNRRPEPLGRDFISAALAEFEVDLPNGEHHLWLLIGDNSANSRVQRFYFNSTVEANGKTVYERKGKPSEIIRHDFFAGHEQFWVPGSNYYDAFIEPKFRQVRATALVTDGKLRLRWKQAPVAALVVAPDPSQLETVVNETNRKRRRDTLVIETGSPFQDRAPWSADAEEKERGFALYQRDVEESLYPWTPPPPGTPRLTRLEGFAAPGQTESLWIDLHGLRDGGELTLKVSDLENARGEVIKARRIATRVARYYEHFNGVHKSIPGDYRYQVRAFPLEPRDTLPLHKGLNWSWSFTVSVPADAKPGVYHGTATVRTTHGTQAALPVSFRVVDIRLVELPILQGFYYFPREPWYATFWGGNAFGADLLSEEADILEILRKNIRAEMSFMRELGLNSIALTDDLRGDLQYKDGEVSLKPNDRYTLWMDLYKEAGFGPMAFFGANPYGPNEGDANRLSWLDPSLKPPFSEQWYRAYHSLIRHLVRHGKERGWPELIWYISDEQSNHGAEGATLGAKIAASLLPLRKEGLRTVASLNGRYERVMVPHLTASMPNYAFPIDEESLAWIEENGSELWIYNCGKDRIMLGLWPWRLGAKARYQWHFSSMRPYPWDGLGWGVDATRYDIAFPGPDGPVPTLASERTRAAITDHRYLATLEAAIAAARNNPERAGAVAKAETFLKSLRERIPVSAARMIAASDPTDVGGRLMHDFGSQKNLDRLRWAVARHILDVEGKP